MTEKQQEIIEEFETIIKLAKENEAYLAEKILTKTLERFKDMIKGNPNEKG